MSIKWNRRTICKLIICILIPLLVGCFSSLLTRNAMLAFDRMAKPPLSPPGWLFQIVWIVMYILMGVASFLILESDAYGRTVAIVIYIIQLIFNFLSSIIFFRSGTYVMAALLLGIMWILVVALIVMSMRISKAAFIMLLPYGAWCTFAMYLNVGVAVLNR